MGLSLRRCLCLLTVLCACALGASGTLMRQGRDAPRPTPAELQGLEALHLRAVGAEMVYTLHLPKTLRDINISANNLPFMPNGLLPAGLERLWMADNRLAALPTDIPALKQLTYLNLDRNLLKTLPDMRGTKLRWLRLNANRLTVFPLLPDSVERLYLAHNRLTAVPETLPKSLKRLNLSGNPLTSVPDRLGAGLEFLDLSDTRLTALPKDLTPWRTLKTLILSNCPLPEAERDRIDAALPPGVTAVIW